MDLKISVEILSSLSPLSPPESPVWSILGGYQNTTITVSSPKKTN